MSTQRFGFENDGLTSGRFATIDRNLLDRLLAALEIHDHSGGATPVPLADPTEAPTATTATTGGTLVDGQTLYYRVGFVDAFGLETAASDELAVALPATPVATEPPVPTGDTQDGATLPADTYYYALTVNSLAGESPLGPTAIITIFATQNQADIGLPALPSGGTSFNVWRMSVADAGWTKVGTAVTGSTFADTGFPRGAALTDPTTQPPDELIGTGTNAVTITVPDSTVVAAVPSGVKAWRLYRTDTSGVYGNESLVAEVVPGPTLPTTFLDTGAVLLTGTPLDISTALTPSVAVAGGGGGGGGGGPYAPGEGPIFIDDNGGQWRQGVSTTGVATFTAVGGAPVSDGRTVATAFPLTGTAGTQVVDSRDHVPGDATHSHPVWYKVTPTADCGVDLDTGGSGNGYDSWLILYSGPADATAVSQLTVLAQNDDRPGSDSLSALHAALTAGTTYYVMAGDYENAGTPGAGSATLTLNWSGINQPNLLPPTNPVIAHNAHNGFTVLFTAPASTANLVRYEARIYKDGVLDPSFTSQAFPPATGDAVPPALRVDAVNVTPTAVGSLYTAGIAAVYVVGGVTYVRESPTRSNSNQSLPGGFAPPSNLAISLSGTNLIATWTQPPSMTYFGEFDASVYRNGVYDGNWTPSYTDDASATGLTFAYVGGGAVPSGTYELQVSTYYTGPGLKSGESAVRRSNSVVVS